MIPGRRPGTITLLAGMAYLAGSMSLPPVVPREAAATASLDRVSVSDRDVSLYLQKLREPCTTHPLPRQSSSGEARAVALLIDFPDRPADQVAHPVALYEELLFSEGVLPDGSLRDFYLEQSYGAWQVTGEVYGWFRSDVPYSFFDDGNFGTSGGNRAAGITAMQFADPTVDFSQFDCDGPDGLPNSGDDDGYVDACFVFASGLSGVDTMDPSDFWPVIGDVTPPFESDDPSANGGWIKIEYFSIQPEMNIGYPSSDTLHSYVAVVAHEYGHIGPGLPDLRDDSRVAWGIGYWGVMGFGAYGYHRTGPYGMSAYSRIRAGWVTPTVLTQNQTDLLLPPVTQQPVIYKVWPHGTAGDEYFLLENRQQTGFDADLPGHGLLVWHVDEGELYGGDPGADPGFDYWLALEQADGNNDLNTWFERPVREEYYPEMGDTGDPFPGSTLNTLFDATTNPSSNDEDGLPSGIRLSNIREVGTDIVLDVEVPPPTAIAVSGLNATATGDGAVVLTWKLGETPGITGIRVYRAAEESGPFAVVSGPRLLAPTQGSFRDHSASSARTAWYALGLVAEDGAEWRSHPVQVRTGPPPVALHQNVPNPFNPSTQIRFSLERPGPVDLAIYDLRGRRVVTLVSQWLEAGSTVVDWDGRDENGRPVASQSYVYRLRTDRQVLSRKLMLIR